MLLQIWALLALSAGSAHPEPLVSLERTACYGDCPEYRVTISADGRVRYEGERNVGVFGPVESQLTPSELAQVVRTIREIDYFGLEEGTCDPLTALMHGPSVITDVKLDGREREIVDNDGLSCWPSSLHRFEALIEDLSHSAHYANALQLPPPTPPLRDRTQFPIP